MFSAKKSDRMTPLLRYRVEGSGEDSVPTKWLLKKNNFIKPQYKNSLNTQHCGRLPENTSVHHAGHLNKKDTEKEITYEHKSTKKERKNK